MPRAHPRAPGFACVVAASAASASAMPIVTFTDEAAFNAATAGFDINAEGFDGLTPGALPRTTPTGVTITATDNGRIQDASYAGASGQVIHFETEAFGSSITFTFATPINAFALDVFDAGTTGPTDVVLITEFGAEIVYDDHDHPARGNEIFLGLTSEDTALAGVRFTNTEEGDVLELDDLRFGAVPEPAALTTLAAGGLLLLRRSCARRLHAADRG